MSHFTTNNITQKRSTCLVEHKQRSYESLISSIYHFNEETTQIKDLNPNVALYALMSSLKHMNLCEFISKAIQDPWRVLKEREKTTSHGRDCCGKSGTKISPLPHNDWGQNENYTNHNRDDDMKREYVPYSLLKQIDLRGFFDTLTIQTSSTYLVRDKQNM